MDQNQYAEHMLAIMEMIGPKLREEDLFRIWQMLDRASSPQVVDNILRILQEAAKTFNAQQFAKVLDLLQKVSKLLNYMVKTY